MGYIMHWPLANVGETCYIHLGMPPRTAWDHWVILLGYSFGCVFIFIWVCCVYVLYSLAMSVCVCLVCWLITLALTSLPLL